MKRVFLIVLDSFGIGEAPDAAEYGDQGSNTLAACFRSGFLEVPNLKKLGLFNIDGVTCGTKESAPTGAFGRCRDCLLYTSSLKALSLTCCIPLRMSLKSAKRKYKA